jgi:CBS domain-containing protein
MLVRDVLVTKGRRVFSIDAEATVSEAIAKLVQNNIGSLPVVDHDGNLVGMFSERDVLRVIHGRGDGFGRLRVADLMSDHPVTCHLDDDVSDDSELIGIVSVGDVIKVLYDKVHTENQHLISYIQGAV